MDEISVYAVSELQRDSQCTKTTQAALTSEDEASRKLEAKTNCLQVTLQKYELDIDQIAIYKVSIQNFSL